MRKNKLLITSFALVTCCAVGVGVTQIAKDNAQTAMAVKKREDRAFEKIK